MDAEAERKGGDQSEKKKWSKKQWGKHSLEGSTFSCQSQAPLVHQGHSRGGACCNRRADVKGLEIMFPTAGVRKKTLIFFSTWFYKQKLNTFIGLPSRKLSPEPQVLALHAGSWRTNSSLFIYCCLCIHIFLGAWMISFLPHFPGWKSFLASVHPWTFYEVFILWRIDVLCRTQELIELGGREEGRRVGVHSELF